MDRIQFLNTLYVSNTFFEEENASSYINTSRKQSNNQQEQYQKQKNDYKECIDEMDDLNDSSLQDIDLKMLNFFNECTKQLKDQYGLTLTQNSYKSSFEIEEQKLPSNYATPNQDLNQRSSLNFSQLLINSDYCYPPIQLQKSFMSFGVSENYKYDHNPYNNSKNEDQNIYIQID